MSDPVNVTTMEWLPTAHTPLTEAAIAYASNGFRVHPVWGLRVTGSNPECACRRKCDTPGKHPVGKGWTKESTIDVDRVRDARRNGQADANIGMAMGGPERLVVVDIDGSLGRESIARLVAKHGPLPETLTSRSGRTDGGEHLLFFVPEHLDIKRIKNRAAVVPGVDTRGENGQIVVPPSVHASGARYEWVKRVPVAELPDWLYDIIAAPEGVSSGRIPVAPTNVVPLSTDNRYIAKVLENACRDISSCGEGNRNHTLFSKAATTLEYYLGAGLPTGDAEQSLVAAGQSCGLSRREAENTVQNALKAAQDSPRFVPPPKGPVTGAPATAPGTAAPWESELLLTGKGEYKNSLSNVMKILRHSEEFQGLAFNEMTQMPELAGRAMEIDVETARIAEKIADKWFFCPNTNDVAKALISVAKEKKSYHPVQDYLRSLSWDGVERINYVAARVLRIPSPTELELTMIRRFFIAAAARALKPGCQQENALVLKGPPGIYKTSFFRTLGFPWFSSNQMDITSTKGLMQLHNTWIYEWGEIEKITNTKQLSDVKNFMSICVDSVVLPYGRATSTLPRAGVIVGTTNEGKFLTDPTGNRRFWVVEVYEQFDLDLLKEWRDQLWAEAVQLIGKEIFHLLPEQDAEREEHLQQYVIEDAWVEPIESYLATANGPITVNRIATEALSIETSRHGGNESKRIISILQKLGYVSGRRAKFNGACVRPWTKRQSAEESSSTVD